jgi:hypothetical protein
MPWSNSRPRAATYGRAHQATRAAHLAALKRAGVGQCAEMRNPGSYCTKRSPLITPGMELHLCHNSRTGEVLGLGHADCNRSEAARRANRMQRAARARVHTRRSRLKW